MVRWEIDASSLKTGNPDPSLPAQCTACVITMPVPRVFSIVCTLTSSVQLKGGYFHDQFTVAGQPMSSIHVLNWPHMLTGSLPQGPTKDGEVLVWAFHGYLPPPIDLGPGPALFKGTATLYDGDNKVVGITAYEYQVV